MTQNGPSNVDPPSFERTTSHWFSSGVSKFSNATYRWPVSGLTVGTENWLSSQAVPPANAPTQNGALPLITFAGDHERAMSSE